MKDSWGALPSSQVGGVAAAISARTADFREETMEKELQPGEERESAPLVKDAQERELADWVEFDFFHPVAPATIRKPIADTRRVLTWKVIGGGTSAKAGLLVTDFQDPDL